ncbi:2OG-Fe(II) oxygenase family protein [Sphingobium sp.]|uniref:2OG-Fe(II) oxygenase n=1 Tax=Sphingobium sp. TaxID=1912891 RepID=UPI00262437C5|nr:2OG-Fe(II) oxygenase family protein [Sphingobium sp.]
MFDMSVALFDLNPTLDVASLSSKFANHGRVQVRDILTRQTAQTVRHILQRETNWGLACQVGTEAPLMLRRHEVAAIDPAKRQALGQSLHRAAAAGDYAVQFHQYPILTAYLEQWAPNSPHDFLLEYINAEPFVNLVRAITGMADLIKADAQATLFGPGDFLSIHNDSHREERWRVAYVLNFSDPGWKPDWGGYLNFLNDDGDIIEGWLPRFNSLNLLRVPQSHQVSYVPPFAPVGRFAITGWFRD